MRKDEGLSKVLCSSNGAKYLLKKSVVEEEKEHEIVT